MTSSRRVPLTCAAIAVAVAGVAALASLSVRDWRVSALVRMSSVEPMAELARAADPDFAFVHPQAHYDGVYFYAIARDPLARGEAHQRIDAGAYRYGHAGYGLLAWLVSGGQPGLVPAALLVVSLAGMAAAGFFASVLARDLGWSPWAGLVVAFSPGAIFAVTADTSEPVAFAATAAALVAWRRQRWGWAAVALVAACMIKEPLVLVPAGLAVWEAVEWFRGKRAADLPVRAGALVAGPLALAVWAAYIRSRFGVWPFSHPTSEFLVAPFTGWADTLRRAAGFATGPFESMQVGHTSVALLVAAGAALLLGIVRAARFRSFVDPIFVLYATLIFCLNWLGLLYPKDLIREAAIPLALLPVVVAGRLNRSAAGDVGPGQG